MKGSEMKWIAISAVVVAIGIIALAQTRPTTSPSTRPVDAETQKKIDASIGRQSLVVGMTMDEAVKAIGNPSEKVNENKFRWRIRYTSGATGGFGANGADSGRFVTTIEVWEAEFTDGRISFCGHGAG